MKGKSKITLGDILDLLDRNDTRIVLRDGDSTLTAHANSKLWRGLEKEVVIGIKTSFDTLNVWLEEEADHEPEEDS